MRLSTDSKPPSGELVATVVSPFDRTVAPCEVRRALSGIASSSNRIKAALDSERSGEAHGWLVVLDDDFDGGRHIPVPTPDSCDSGELDLACSVAIM